MTSREIPPDRPWYGRWRLPIAPFPAHAPSNTQLLLKNNVQLKKPSYVKIDVVHQVPITILEWYYRREYVQVPQLDKPSFDTVVQQLRESDHVDQSYLPPLVEVSTDVPTSLSSNRLLNAGPTSSGYHGDIGSRYDSSNNFGHGGPRPIQVDHRLTPAAQTYLNAATNPSPRRSPSQMSPQQPRLWHSHTAPQHPRQPPPRAIPQPSNYTPHYYGSITTSYDPESGRNTARRMRGPPDDASGSRGIYTIGVIAVIAAVCFVAGKLASWW